jgi:hypothetical protein
MEANLRETGWLVNFMDKVNVALLMEIVTLATITMGFRVDRASWCLKMEANTTVVGLKTSDTAKASRPLLMVTLARECSLKDNKKVRESSYGKLGDLIRDSF